MDLENLVALLREKTGMDEEKARQTIEVVLKQVREKLPAPAQSYIDSMMDVDDKAVGMETIEMSAAIMGIDIAVNDQSVSPE